MNRRFQIFLCVTLMASVCLTGCQQLRARFCCSPAAFDAESMWVEDVPLIPISVDRRFQHQERKRILLIASGQDVGSYESTSRLLESLKLQFSQHDLQEAIAPYQLRLRTYFDQIQQGKMDEYEIASLSREFNADTIALVRINQLDAVRPMRLSVSIAFVDCAESFVFCSIENAWDLADPATQRAFQRYLKQRSGGEAATQELRAESPSQLFEFAAYQICKSLAASPY